MKNHLDAILAGHGNWALFNSDNIEFLRGVPENSVDAIVTDPPAGINFMNVKFDSDKGGRDKWIDWMTDVMWQCFSVLKPGGHALVWALPRTSHWTATAIEDAGFEIRDIVQHVYGVGFPKSLDISKSIDKKAGVRRKVLGKYRTPGGQELTTYNNWQDKSIKAGTQGRRTPLITAPSTDEAKKWSGFGTGLKPAAEHWILCRKPIEGTVTGNVIKHGTGGLNIDDCRIHSGSKVSGGGNNFNVWRQSEGRADRPKKHCNSTKGHSLGRWPANLILSHSASCEISGTRLVKGDSRANLASPKGVRPSGFVGTGSDNGNGKPCGSLQGDAEIETYICAPDCPVAELDRQSGLVGAAAPVRGTEPSEAVTSTSGITNKRKRVPGAFHADKGGASRFFKTFAPEEPDFNFQYISKASRKDRGGDFNKHPTVKPVNLMKYLCRLITPPGGLILDPFAGSGTTIVAALQEGFRCIGVEQDASYCQIILKRIQAQTKK